MDRGDDLPTSVRSILIPTQAKTESVVAFRSELAGAFVSAQQAAQTHSFGNLPLVVVSAEHSFDKFFPPHGREHAPAMNEKWMRLQDELVALSTKGVHMVDKDATHGIAREKPDFVISAIRWALRLQAASRVTSPDLPITLRLPHALCHLSAGQFCFCLSGLCGCSRPSFSQSSLAGNRCSARFQVLTVMRCLR